MLIIVAAIGLYGWIGSAEPDCYYSTKVFLQIRLCGEGYVDRQESVNLLPPIALLSVLVIGIALRLHPLSRRSDGYQSDAD